MTVVAGLLLGLRAFLVTHAVLAAENLALRVARELTGPSDIRCTFQPPFTGAAEEQSAGGLQGNEAHAELPADQHDLLFTALPSPRYPHGRHPTNPKRLSSTFALF